jgi:hypothetical protein
MRWLINSEVRIKVGTTAQSNFPTTGEIEERRTDLKESLFHQNEAVLCIGQPEFLVQSEGERVLYSSSA